MTSPEQEYKNLVEQIQSNNIKITPEIEALAEEIWNSPNNPELRRKFPSEPTPNPPMGEGWDHHTPPERY